MPERAVGAIIYGTLNRKREIIMAENKELKASTEAKRQKKAERALLIFGVLIIMFAFAGGYNYFSKPATIEKYMTDNGIDQMYSGVPVTEHTTMTLKADKNTVKIWLNIAEDAPDSELEQYKGEDGTKTLKNMGAYFLTSMKPQTRALSGTVKIKAKQGDETVNYVKMSYSEAKKFAKEAQKEAEEGIDTDAEEDADADADAEAPETEEE